MKRWLALAVAAAGVLAVTAPAGRAIEIRGAVVSDGKRWAAWSSEPGTVDVYDDRSGTRRRLGVPDCPLGGIGSGRLLLQCPDPAYGPDHPVLVDVRTGERTDVDGADIVGQTGAYQRYLGVGSRGILVRLDGYHYWNVFAFDWRTRTSRQLDDRDRTVDLDRRSLTRPLCDPVRRSPNPDAALASQAQPPYLPMSPSGRWAVEFVAAPTEEGAPPGAVRLWRCGQPRPRVLARCNCFERPAIGARGSCRRATAASPRPAGHCCSGTSARRPRSHRGG
jgi:hypothetical protein